MEILHETTQRGHILSRASSRSPGVSPLSIENTAVRLTLPSGGDYKAFVTTAFDRETGLFWWTLKGSGSYDPEDRIADFNQRFTIYKSDREIVGVQLDTPPPSLWIVRSTARAASMEEARQRAVGSIAPAARRIEDGSARWQQQANLWGALPNDFLRRPGNNGFRLDMEITSIDRRPGGWTVLLTSHDGRLAEILLDNLFVLVESRLATPEPTTKPTGG